MSILEIVDGMWGAWSSYGPCSVTCQASSRRVSGTKTRTRTCSDPAPLYKGKPCVGSASQKLTCTPTDRCRGIDSRLIMSGINDHINNMKY
jgi:hypothetical protein